MLNFTFDPKTRAAGISLLTTEETRTVELIPGALYAFLDDAGELTSIEILNTRRFASDGFTDADAARTVAWVREQLATLAAS